MVACDDESCTVHVQIIYTERQVTVGVLLFDEHLHKTLT